MKQLLGLLLVPIIGALCSVLPPLIGGQPITWITVIGVGLNSFAFGMMLLNVTYKTWLPPLSFGAGRETQRRAGSGKP